MASGTALLQRRVDDIAAIGGGGATAGLGEYNEDTLVFADSSTGVRCRLVTTAQRVPVSDMAEYPIVTTYKLLLPADTDVREGDRITSVVTERAEAGPFSVNAVRHRSFSM